MQPDKIQAQACPKALGEGYPQLGRVVLRKVGPTIQHTSLIAVSVDQCAVSQTSQTSRARTHRRTSQAGECTGHKESKNANAARCYVIIAATGTGGTVPLRTECESKRLSVVFHAFARQNGQNNPTDVRREYTCTVSLSCTTRNNIL